MKKRIDMNEGKYIESLISQYAALIKKPSKDMACPKRENAISNTLVKEADWTKSGADLLLTLANDYGAFMLRNALALAVVLDKEDGDRLY
ncbi:MAG: hypothetical protein K4571_03935 [Deltaproteobacteria bacterium]